MNNFTCLDLFAGASGLAEGFVRNGFKVVAHIEKDPSACFTIKTRLAYHYLKKNNKLSLYSNYLLTKISRDELYSNIPEYILSSVINRQITNNNFNMTLKEIKEKQLKNVDVIIGGPPCQLYSHVGRAKVKDPDKRKKDPRYNLYKIYSKFLKALRPDIFVFENVPGLLSSDEGKLKKRVEKHFEKAGYKFDCKTLNAYDFGVLQGRQRVFFIGWNKELKLQYPEFKKWKNNGWYIKDLFEDLPPLQPGQNLIPRKCVDIPMKYLKNPSAYLKKFKIRTNENILINHVTRNHNHRDRQIYKLAIEKWNKEKKRLRYVDVPLKYRTHNNMDSFLDRYKVVSEDLPYSQTVVAHISKDGHYYIHPDINQARSLSVREAARLQSFEDNHFFEGHMISKFRQIGNAVPPLMAERIAEKIKLMLP